MTGKQGLKKKTTEGQLKFQFNLLPYLFTDLAACEPSNFLCKNRTGAQ